MPSSRIVAYDGGAIGGGVIERMCSLYLCADSFCVVMARLHLMDDCTLDRPPQYCGKCGLTYF
eukprot:CAMPEP_0119359786 /NCGR_PEP_ID=MMETSP1334-20130426/7585_1 /TAXON_ID=127549 /ORGANISM="Calcidiscus leptoporus, Strain RCC1130" /LENGTH=62 /DNA_ID=CAMNT_0007374515 /DNA_START=194 /DNA_END=379 /DNA_ORIENTATION=-